MTDYLKLERELADMEEKVVPSPLYAVLPKLRRALRLAAVVEEVERALRECVLWMATREKIGAGTRIVDAARAALARIKAAKEG